MSADEAEALALQTLAFLAGDGARLHRFLALSGVDPAELRASAEAAHMQLAVLDHVLTDESLLLVAAADMGIVPEAFQKAHNLLSGARMK
jgi:hypothetical protein